jgi:hypothetical protein
MTRAQILLLYAKTRDGFVPAAEREKAHKLLMKEVAHDAQPSRRNAQVLAQPKEIR